jgi:cytoskeletal protein CcmA (bactofilin family)
MFNKSKKMKAVNINFEKMDTLIGQGTLCEGSINASGTVRIDGEFKGEIKTKGDLIIGEDGKVEAAVNSRNVYIGGSLRGDIKAEGKVELAVTGKLNGDIVVGDLLIEEGAVFNGNCKMQNNQCKMQIGAVEVKAAAEPSKDLQMGKNNEKSAKKL